MENKSKLLLIDDEQIVLDSCAEILADGGCEIVTATNGATGLKLIRDCAPDLVFVDLKMPGISGFQVLEQVQAADPTIVTIVITGFATVSSAVEAMKKGAFDFLPKPFTPDEFRLITRRGLEKRRLVMETIALRREKEMLREQFAAIVSHELKSPLGAVQQSLYALASELSESITDTQKNRLERCQIRIDDLLKLIQTWLRVMSADMGKIRENFRPVSVADIVAKAIENVQPHAIRKDVEIAATVQEPRAQVSGDEGTLVEALVNLLGNAIKYSRIGSRVQVIAEKAENVIAITVRDRGVGIVKEDLPHIFEDFYAGKAGGETGGCGLGLAITRRIVEEHDGTISVDSQPGEGSTFVIRLPVLASESVVTQGASCASI
jgi:signal transduction histidine kinase